MKTFINENLCSETLQKYLSGKGCNDLVLVQAEYKRPGTFDNYSDFVGFDIALNINLDNAVIIFCSFFEEQEFIKSKDWSAKFFAVMAKKRTGFLSIINAPEVFYQKYLELVNDEKEEDRLAIELNKIQDYKKTMAGLQHSVSGRFDYKDVRAPLLIKEARRVGVTGNDEEVFRAITEFKYSKNSKFAGKYFSGVFCDVEGTLLINGEVNSELLEELKKLSLAKPITLWTAGDVEEYREELVFHNILWKLVSKVDFVGAEVEIAYDDLSEKDFSERFGIKVRKFNQIKD